LADHITGPTTVEGVGAKLIEEFVGRVNTNDESVSIAKMTSPPGWSEPAQTPDFDEWTIVLSGAVVVEHEGGRIEVKPGEAVHARAGERVQYSTPDGAEYIAVCSPAFSPQAAHRDE